MALDLSKIKGISDEVKAKLVKIKNKDEFDALVKAENLSAEQLKELSGGGIPFGPDCPEDWCGGFDNSCVTLGCNRLPF